MGSITYILVTVIDNKWLKIDVYFLSQSNLILKIQSRVSFYIFTAENSFLDKYFSLDAHKEFGYCFLIFKIKKMYM